MAGKQMPTGRASAPFSAATVARRVLVVSMMSFGRPPLGVGSFTRSESSLPVDRSTTAPLIPVPPMSMPMAMDELIVKT